MAGSDATDRIEEFDDALFAAWADALPSVKPPASLRERVLSRVRTPNRNELLRTVRAENGWVDYVPGIQFKMLFRDEDARMNTFLARLQPGVSMPEHTHGATEECLVIDGEIMLGSVRVRAGDFHLAHKGARHGVLTTSAGALIYLRVGWGEHVPEPVSS